MFRFASRHASYANVVASIALFVALGGTSYAALKLPRDSVGAEQIRKGAVDTAELHYRSITGDKLGTDVLRPRHVSPRLKRYIESKVRGGPQGPAGKDAISEWAVLDGAGVMLRGTAMRVDHRRGANSYELEFARTVGECAVTASPTSLGTPEEGFVYGPKSVVVDVSYGSKLRVSTFGADGRPSEESFNVIVACYTDARRP